MKQIVLAAVLSFGAITSPVFTQAASAQTQLESVRDMASWMQSATTIQTDLMTLFSGDEMAGIYATLDSGDSAAIKLMGQKFEAERQVVLARANRQINDLSPPEKWNIDRTLFSRQDRTIYSAAKKQYESLQETYSLFDTLTGTLSDILNGADDLDDKSLQEMVAVQHKASIRLIELENQQIDGYLDAIPKDNPNHQLQKIFKQFNLATIPELEISIVSGSLEDRQSLGDAMGKELNKIGPLVREGQKNTKIQIKRMKEFQNRKLSPSDQVMVPIVIKQMESFDEAFRVETEMLDAMQSSSRLYISDKSDEEIASTIDENDIVFFRLLETRAELMQYRLSLLQ